jgi:hypothetical protein
MTTPFSLSIFVADGDPDGLRIVDKSHWIGKELVFPRALPSQVCRAHHSIASIHIVTSALCAINDGC